MAVTGRPRIPDHLKKIKGTFRPSRSNPLSPSFIPLKKAPRPIIQLNKVGKKVYKKVCDALIAQKLICDIDVDLILILALEHEELHTCYDMIRNCGGRVDDKTGGPGCYVKMKDKAINNILELNKILYLTPALRQKLQLSTSPDPEGDPMDGLL